MTRRFAPAIWGTCLAIAFVAEAAGAVVAMRAFVSRTAMGAGTLLPLIAASVLFAGALTLLTMSALHTAISNARGRRQDRESSERDAWTDRWIQVVFGEADPPTGPLSRPAVTSLLDMKDSLVGEPAEMVGSLMRDYGIETKLIERLERLHRKTEGPGHKTVIKPRRTLGRRLELLDDLGRARTPMAVPTLLDAASDPEPQARLAGVRALARSVAAIGTEHERRAAATEVLRVLHDARLSTGSVMEALELLGPAAPHAIAPILDQPQRYGNRMLIAAIETAGYQRLNDLAAPIAAFASSRRVEIRLAALHALAKMDRLPAAVAPAIRKAFRDRDPAIRIEAARAAKLLETKTAISYLEDLLCDGDWTVRRVAATTLAGLGGPGIRTLIATSLVHGDHRARSIATQVLVESRSAAELESEPEKVG